MILLRPREPMVYSRAERLSDAAVHVAGIGAALIGAPVLVTLAIVWFGDVSTIAAALVYALSLLAMLCCSALYNMSRSPDWHDTFRRIDQSAIYLKIAGAYTPFAVLSGSQAGLFLAGVWGAAVLGVSMIAFGSPRMRRPALLLYLAIGWAGVVAGEPLIAAMTPLGFALVIAAGLLYTAGVVFYLWEQLPFHNTIWHVFVLAASGVLYAALIVELWGRAPAG